MENNIAKDLIESFGYEHQINELSASDAWDTTKAIAGSDEVHSLAKTAAAGAAAGKIASKALGRTIPGVGTAISWKDAYDRWKSGDRSGAVLSALAGAAYLFGPAGAAVGLGLDAAQAGRDYANKDNAEVDSDTDTDSLPSSDDNKLKALQQLIGAKPDGIYGPETKQKLMAWQKEQGIKVDGIPGPETYSTAGLAESKGINMKKLTSAEDIAILRDKLSIIESQELDEAAWYDALKAAGKGAEKYASSGFGKVKQAASNFPAKFKEPGFPGGGAGGVGDDIAKSAGDASGQLAKTGAKTGEYIGKGQQTGDLAAKVGNVINGDFKTVEKSMSALGPEQLKKLSQSVLKNPKLKYSEKYAIQKMGLLNWIKANPVKAGLISGIAGSVLGYTLGGDSQQATSAHSSSSSKGDPEVMDKQRILNDLGANLVVDGVWGSETEKAYQEYWVKNFAKHNALSTGASPEEADKRQANWNAASQMGKPSQPIPGDVNAQISQSELDKKEADLKAAADVAAEKAKKDQAEYDAKKQKSVAESIATLRDLLNSIENK